MWSGRNCLSHNPILTGEYFPYKRIAYYISNHRIIAKVGDELISWDVINFEVGQSTDERSINVCGGFWFLEEISRIRVGITGIGSSNHSPSEQVWVRILALEVWSAPFAVDVVRVLIHGWKRGGSMVYSLWELVTVSNHVWHAQWIASKNVVHLHQSHYVQLYCYHSTQKHYTSSCFAHLVFLFSSIFSVSLFLPDFLQLEWVWKERLLCCRNVRLCWSEWDCEHAQGEEKKWQLGAACCSLQVWKEAHLWDPFAENYQGETV